MKTLHKCCFSAGVIPAKAGIQFLERFWIPVFAGMTALLFYVAIAFPVFASFSSDIPLSNPEQEARAKALFEEIRCVVCVSQSLADSDVGLAKDLRKIIREKIEAGEPDAAIKAYLVGRYGEQVLMEPAVNPQTIWLWVIPLLLLLAGGTAIFTLTRKKT